MCSVDDESIIFYFCNFVSIYQCVFNVGNVESEKIIFSNYIFKINSFYFDGYLYFISGVQVDVNIYVIYYRVGRQYIYVYVQINMSYFLVNMVKVNDI